MARELIEKLIDDLDGTEAAETVGFGLDGATYEIDLSKRNAAALRKALERYVSAARTSSGTTSRPPRGGGAAASAKRSARKRAATPKRDFDLDALREWAAANDVAVPSRGRIPRTVVEQHKTSGGR